VIADAPAEDQRPVGFGQQIDGSVHLIGRRGHRRGRPVARRVHVGQRNPVRYFRFLHHHVDRHIGRRARPTGRDALGAGDGIETGLQGDRLVGPFGHVAHDVALRVGRMDPVGLAPVRRIGRARTAQHHHRLAVGHGVVERHQPVLHADQIVHDRHRRLAGRLAIALRHGDGHFLMRHQDEGRLVVARVVDQAVMQPPEAGARREEHVIVPECADQLGDHVRAVLGVGPVGRQVDRRL